MNETWRNISGAPYAWEATLTPERPYLHDYTKALTTKLFLAVPNAAHDASVVKMTFAQAAEVIRRIDAMTPGLRKIVYLVGWQYFGHDSKYPAWHAVNAALKRPEDATALASYLWLYEEAKRCNTTLSVHINMYDAYRDSPLWDTYVREGLLALGEDGTPLRAGVWNNQQAYAVSYAREWDSGYAKKRIDELCALLPLREAGTVHIDAFHARPDVGHGLSLEDTQRGRNRIIRYWRDLGIDVTSEFLYYDTPSYTPRVEQMVGLMPLAFHFSQTLMDYVTRPAGLICGTVISHRFKEGESARMGRLFGESCNGEAILQEHPEDWQPHFFREFMLKNLKFLYLNTLQRESATVTPDETRAAFSEGVVTHMNAPLMEKQGAVMQRGTDLLVPAPWHQPGAAIAYSEEGGSFSYDAGTILGWARDAEIRGRRLTPDGAAKEVEAFRLTGGRLHLSLRANEAMLLEEV